MKKTLFILSIVAALLAAISIRARDYPLNELRSTTSVTILSVTTAATGSALDVEHVTHHTFQIITVCTNDAITTLDRSLNGSAWTPFFTNAPSATSTNDTTIIGKWVYVRARFDDAADTNSTVTVLYLGQ